MKKSRKMDQYVEDLFNAVKKVDSKYVKFRHIKGFNDVLTINEQDLIDNSILLNFIESQKTEIEKSLESVFCYELYYCWRKFMINNSGRYNDLVLNGEIGKMNLSAFIENYNNSTNNPLFRELSLASILEKGHLFPDFTLHGGNNDTQNQKLIVEVKTNENLTDENFKTDFYRLAIFQKLYGFENVVFIILNKKIRDLVSYLENVKIELVNKKNFYFILKSEDLEYCFNLDEIS